MGTDALKDLRAWQRQQASQQERALRAARKAKGLIDELDRKRVDAVVGLVAAVAVLEQTGLSREQCAALLDTTPEEISRTAAACRRAAAPRSTAGQRTEGGR